MAGPQSRHEEEPTGADDPNDQAVRT
jgi:hypothetical protein